MKKRPGKNKNLNNEPAIDRMCNDEISLGNELNDYDENKTHKKKSE